VAQAGRPEAGGDDYDGDGRPAVKPRRCAQPGTLAERTLHADEELDEDWREQQANRDLKERIHAPDAVCPEGEDADDGRVARGRPPAATTHRQQRHHGQHQLEGDEPPGKPGERRPVGDVVA
jgi:hypothetical protein